MSEEYVYGRLTVDYGIEVVSLIHKTQGRVSYMFLAEGDFIELKEGSNWKAISVETILRTVASRSNEGSPWKQGESFYQNCYVRVKLNPSKNRGINTLEKRWALKKILSYVESGFISREEATRALMEFEQEDD